MSADPPARNLEWSRALELPFRLLSDPDGRASRAWGVWDDTWSLSRRVTFIVDRAGAVRWVDAGGLAVKTDRTLHALTELAKPEGRK